MGLFDIQCNGCMETFPNDEKTRRGAPKDGHVRRLGGTFSLTYVCHDCWKVALEHGFDLDESKDKVERWKEEAKIWKQEKDKREAPLRTAKAAEMRRTCLEEASKEMFEDLTFDLEQIVNDVLLPNEKIICKIRSSKDGNRSQAVLTNRNLIIVNKGLSGGQGQDTPSILGTLMAIGRVSVRIYPISEIRSIEIQPLQGMSVGHFQVLTNTTLENDNESKFLFDTNIGYYKSILLYRKIRQMQLVRVEPKADQAKASI